MRITYLTEQLGAVETDLKGEIVERLEKLGSPARAYLVSVLHAESGDSSVTLCIYIEERWRKFVVHQVTDIFEAMFSKAEYLDIVFLDAEEEKKVQAICKPFFEYETA